jgi:hypothetical protein
MPGIYLYLVRCGSTHRGATAIGSDKIPDPVFEGGWRIYRKAKGPNAFQELLLRHLLGHDVGMIRIPRAQTITPDQSAFRL